MKDHILDCGMDGDENEVVQVRSINRLLNRIYMHHVQPMKKDVCHMRERLNSHINEETEMMAEIRGGMKVLKYIGLIALALLVIQGVPLAETLLKMFR